MSSSNNHRIVKETRKRKSSWKMEIRRLLQQQLQLQQQRPIFLIVLVSKQNMNYIFYCFPVFLLVSLHTLAHRLSSALPLPPTKQNGWKKNSGGEKTFFGVVSLTHCWYQMTIYDNVFWTTRTMAETKRRQGRQKVKLGQESLSNQWKVIRN